MKVLEFVKGDTWYFALVLRDSEYNGILLGEDDHAVFHTFSESKIPSDRENNICIRPNLRQVCFLL